MSIVKLPKAFDALSQDALVLTQTQRMAMHTLEAIASKQRRQNLVWKPLAVRAYNYWLEQVWSIQKSFTDYSGKVLLSPYQEQMIWKRVLRESSLGDVIVNFTQTAKQVSQAYKLVHAYGFELSEFINDNNPDCRAYHSWHEQFDNICDVQGLVPSCRLPSIITSWIQSDVMTPPPELMLFGFDEIVPAIKSLVESMSSKGTHVYSQLPDGNVSTPTYFSYETVQEQLKVTVDNVCKDLMQGRERIAIVAPDMSKYNDDLLEKVSEKLGTLQESFVVKTSVPNQLTKTHLVSVASKLIALPHSQRPVDEWCFWLRTELIELGSESQRHILSDLLERTGRESFSIDDVIALIKDYRAKKEIPDFCQDVVSAMSTVSMMAYEDAGTPAQWVNYWLKVLKVMGWCCGELTVRDVEHHNAYVSALQNFSSLGLVEGSMTRYQALQFYRSYIAQQVFHSNVRDPNVYLLSAFEASTLSFDVMYAIGFDDKSWPQSPAPNPFVPINIQRDQLVPHCSAERELHYAKLITSRLVECSPDVVFSYAESVDGSQQVLSPMMNQKLVTKRLIDASSEIESIPVTWVEDSHTRPLEEGERQLGGTYALKDHSSCPFKSFALHRLGLKSYNKLAPGLSFQARGNLLHYAMESFWKSCKNKAGLVKLFESGQWDDELSNHAQRAFERVTKHSRALRGSRFGELEVKRVISLMDQWLKLELQRPEFSVRSIEKKLQLSIGGLTLSMIIDRIDETEDGNQVIIDYKTGKCSVNDWSGDRMRDPQMPLNSIALGDVVGVAFAKLQAKSIEFHGVTFSESLLPGVKALHNQPRLKLPKNWEQLLEYWRNSLELLAKDFAEGNASVEPRSYDSCTHCHLASVCRINDTQKVA